MAAVDRLITIIRALLAKAKSTDSEAERETFMAKAMDLMEKHQIAEYELHNEDEIGMTEGVMGQAGMSSYKADVQKHLTWYYGCKTVTNNQPGGRLYRIELFGPESSRATTLIMTDFVWAQVLELGKVWGAQYGKNAQIGTRHIAKALMQRLAWLVAERKAKAREAPAGSCFSLVVVDATRAFLERAHPVTRQLKHGKRDIRHSAATLAAGISIHQQIASKPTHALK